jgi:hypothetical protein
VDNFSVFCARKRREFIMMLGGTADEDDLA